MTESVTVLDKGFLRLVDKMGNEKTIVDAARQSYGEGTKTVSEDRGLIRYLMKHWHTTPFEMCEVAFQIKAPMFVARQILRHRTASVNEVSARYSIVPDEYYIPSIENMGAQSKVNGQGRDLEGLSEDVALVAIDDITGCAKYGQYYYESLIKAGVARELARMVIPQNIYTTFTWKIDLHNLLHFIRLRHDSHAQYEVQEYAKAMADIVKEWLPNVYEAFLDYRVNAVTFSAQQMEELRRIINYGSSLQPDNLSKREYKELLDNVRGE